MQAVDSSHVRNSGQKSVTNIDKLQLLIWKNFLIQCRHYIRTIIEILLFAQFICPLYFIDLSNQNNIPDEYIIRMYETMGTIVGVLIVLSFMFPTVNSVRYITIEKERQLKEAMKIMGLESWMHWISWFIRIMVFMIIAMGIIVALLKLSLYADWSVLLVFLFVYSISMITYCFMLSVFFSKANIATVVAGIVWLALVVPFSFSLETGTSKVLSCISSNTAILFGFKLIYKFEVVHKNQGVHWSDFWEKPTSSDNLSLGIVTSFILVTSLLYLLIALYVEKVFPGEYGVPEKFYFPFTKTFWCGMSADEATENGTNQLNPNYEIDPRNRHAGVKVKNLRKVYANKKTAVNGLTLNMFDDQITVLLGHNGAGKTTAMSMLTGMFPPTSGTATINGHDIRTNIQKARSSLGYCPQHNILFDELTVSEHIEFFGRLKGLRKSEVKNEVNKYVTQLELEHKRNALSQSLSGGMKRKLSVAIALCGNSRVVFCDEPTSGMDPTARRALWDLLQKEKKGRTILLTTHFMDEADVLGDRIAIVAEGELKCYGTSFFLKKRFGSGYRLVCVKSDGCRSSDVTKVLHEFIPEVVVHEDIASELVYILPVEHVNQFKNVFEVLEEKQNELKLSSFGVSMTPLEEIFFAVASDSMILDKNDNNRHHNNNISTSDPESSAADTPLLRGFSLHINQWHAMFKKRFFCWMRSWIMVLLQTIAPVCTVTTIILSNRSVVKEFGALIVIVFSIAVAFVSSFYILFYVRERSSKSKLLQFVSGVDIRTYWISSFLFDFITYLVIVAISIIPLIVFRDEILKDLTPLIAALLTFGLSVFPMIFLLSFLFSSPSKGLIVMVVFSVIIDFVLWFIQYILVQRNLSETAKILEWIFLALPQYSLLRCAESLVSNQTPSANVYDWKEPGIGRHLTYMSVSGLVYFALLFMVEFRVFSKATQCIRGAFEGKLPRQPSAQGIDDDVTEEKKKVDAMSTQDLHVNNLVLRKLSKFYGKFLAVNQISVAVKRAECFGLLGVNGAGKTSTFKMLTGDASISSGEAFVQGVRLKMNMMQVRKIIGYCPQFDALLDDLTGSETLEIFALLRGVRCENISVLSNRLANELNFQKHVDKKVRELSGGNKRKLSTAIALIGNPMVIYFDEPTTGMDPAAKRNLWSLVSKVRSSGKSIVLTSHSMEECEALCTRLAIMVNGEFKCLGSTQHLKNKFSKSFWITIKIKENIETEMENDALKIKNFIDQSFPGANLNEEYVGLMKFYVPPSDLRWSSVFGIMEEAKQTMPIEDYSIGQTSLEQVFLSLTKLQRDQKVTKV